MSYSDFVPSLIEKMRLQLALQDWEQTAETAHRLVQHIALDFLVDFTENK